MVVSSGAWGNKPNTANPGSNPAGHTDMGYCFRLIWMPRKGSIRGLYLHPEIRFVFLIDPSLIFFFKKKKLKDFRPIIRLISYVYGLKSRFHLICFDNNSFNMFIMSKLKIFVFVFNATSIMITYSCHLFFSLILVIYIFENNPWLSTFGNYHMFLASIFRLL